MRHFIFILFLASVVFSQVDSVSSVTFDRFRYEELNISIYVEDVVNDSVGDSILITLFGRNKTNSTAGGLVGAFTEWERVYFNSIEAPDFRSPADYPEIDSVIKITPVPDSNWVEIPNISTPLFSQMRVDATFRNTNTNPTSSGSNTRVFLQVIQRARLGRGTGSTVFKVSSLDTLVSP